MSSSHHSSNQAIAEAAQTPSIQAIAEAAQTTYKLSWVMKCHRWFHRSMYDKSLSGDNFDEELLPKLRLVSSTWMKKSFVISNNIVAIIIGLGLGIAAIATNKTERQYLFSLIAFCIFFNIFAHNIVMLTYFKLEVEPLEVMGSLELLFRINTVWSSRVWCNITWPISTCVSVAAYHFTIGEYFTIFDLVKLMKSAPS